MEKTNSQKIRENLVSPIALAGMLLGIGFVIAALVGASTVLKTAGRDNVITVTGSAKKEVVSDEARWVSSVARTVPASSIKEGYDQLARDLVVIKKHFKANGFAEDTYTVSNVFTDEVYENRTVEPDQKKYTLRQTIEVKSKDIDKLAALSKNTEQIFAAGIILQSSAPEYTVSSLPDLRVGLLSDALIDAKARAEAIAKLSNSKVGKLKTAGSGVVQVLQPGSQEVSDYGTYDTSTVNKEVMVTVRASFFLK